MRYALSFLFAIFVGHAAQAQDKAPVNAGPYVPSPTSVVSDMLTLAEVGPKDFVIDLGSGDGRIVLTAAKVFGARGFGVDINEKLVKEANEAAKVQGVADRASFTIQDLFKTDIRKATVLTMYLLPNTVNMLKDKLLSELNPGTRILSHDYPLSGWVPEKYVQMDLEDKVAISGVTTTLIYLYVVPAKVEGNWNARLPANLSREPVRIALKQQITRLAGIARISGKDVVLEEAKMRGERITFRLPMGNTTYEFTGSVKGSSIEGTVEGSGQKVAWAASSGPIAPTSAQTKPDEQQSSVAPSTSKPAQKQQSSSGTGFFVSRAGHVLTNAHVVQNCGVIELKHSGRPALNAKVVATDARNDLALLLADRPSSGIATFRSGPALRQAEGIMSFGYPLSGALASSGNATIGNITALAGLRDDTRFLQISAPVQPGNSGGPLLDLSGNVVGVVVSKLDAIRVASATGDIPQNVNFAIKGTLATSFLEANSVKPETATLGKSQSPADVAEKARDFTVLVNCLSK